MKLELDSESTLPAYVQIRNQLRERILRGDLAAGTQLPPERTLARTLGISRTTVVNAYDELEAEGLVRGHVGRGTIVAAGATWMDAQPIKPAQAKARLTEGSDLVIVCIVSA